MNLLIEILRSVLWGGDGPLDEDPVKVLPLAVQQSVCGIVAFWVQENGAVFGRDTVSKFRPYLNAVYKSHLATSEAMETAVNALRKHGIDPILLKGESVSSYYPDPAIRQCGDIDLYVGEENYESACGILRSVCSSTVESTDKHSGFRMGKIEVELHSRMDTLPWPSKDRLFALLEKSASGCRERRKVGENKFEVNVLGPTFNAFFIFHHFLVHFMNSGLGLRQICDWTLLLHCEKGNIDLDKLGRMLDLMDYRREWRVFSDFAVNVIGLPVEECPFYDGKHNPRYCGIIQDRLAEDGNFGKKWKKYRKSAGGFSLKIKTFLKMTGRYASVFPLFPGLTLRYFLNSVKSGIGKI